MLVMLTGFDPATSLAVQEQPIPALTWGGMALAP